MNKDWSDKNKEMQKLISKEATFKKGIEVLIELRKDIFAQITHIAMDYPEEAFSQMPFGGGDGNHNATLAFSIWHTFRIEDIVAHEMIAGDSQIFFKEDFSKAIHSPIITTANEIPDDKMEEFSKKLDIKELYRYAEAVMESSNQMLMNLEYSDLKRKFGDDMILKLKKTGCVSEDEKSAWLIDYWCSKDVLGLIMMPFSRHWIMHVEAMQRIKNKLCKIARKGIDPVAYCGLSCNHCFLSEWCGSCRSIYNTCSFATVSPDRICPNVKCCGEKGFDGCYECDEIESCVKGFYVPSNDGANAAKAQSLYIKKYGKKEFLKVHDRLHKKYDFSKTQEVLGQDYKEGLRILEET